MEAPSAEMTTVSSSQKTSAEPAAPELAASEKTSRTSKSKSPKSAIIAESAVEVPEPTRANPADSSESSLAPEQALLPSAEQREPQPTVPEVMALQVPEQAAAQPAVSEIPDKTTTESNASEMAIPPMPESNPKHEIFADIGPVILDVLSAPVAPVAPMEVEPIAQPVGENGKSTTEPAPKADAEFEAKPAVKLSDSKPEATDDNVPRRERKDSGKDIDLEPLPKDASSAAVTVSELQFTPASVMQAQPSALREADSGFWEIPPEAEPAKDAISTTAEFDSTPTPATDEPVRAPAQVVDSSEKQKEPVINAGDSTATQAKNEDVSQKEEAKPDVAELQSLKETELAPLPETSEPVVETSVKAKPKADSEIKSETKSEVKAIAPSPEEVAKKFADTVESEVVAGSSSSSSSSNEEFEKTQAKGKEVELPLKTEKVEPFPSYREQESELTMQQTPIVEKETIEPNSMAKPESQPETEPSVVPSLPDNDQSAGPADAKEAQPSIEPQKESAGKSKVSVDSHDTTIQPAAVASVHNSSSGIQPAAPTVLPAKPAPEQATAKDSGAASVQPCSATVRQRSWKKRFLSLRYPAGVLFGGRGM